ncbi:hypothetical protein DSO57_1017731 [Entomophthora muscae]|uniref:Uncharacterized protein n=1 Tax=Entomophthora muscae TaxID=34485 RepID=A0ACC2TF57_9FUNG|nr:hypothetical protein DSO57_1017731 [Entomophthora muscae]
MKFYTATLIALVTAQAAAQSFDKSSLEADSQPAAQSSQNFVPIIKRDDKFSEYLNKVTEGTGKVLKDVRKAVFEPFKKPTTDEKIRNAADKYGEKVFNTIVDSTVKVKNNVNGIIQKANTPKTSPKFKEVREKYGLKP